MCTYIKRFLNRSPIYGQMFSINGYWHLRVAPSHHNRRKITEKRQTSECYCMCLILILILATLADLGDCRVTSIGQEVYDFYVYLEDEIPNKKVEYM